MLTFTFLYLEGFLGFIDFIALNSAAVMVVLSLMIFSTTLSIPFNVPFPILPFVNYVHVDSILTVYCGSKYNIGTINKYPFLTPTDIQNVIPIIISVLIQEMKFNRFFSNNIVWIFIF